MGDAGTIVYIFSVVLAFIILIAGFVVSTWGGNIGAGGTMITIGMIRRAHTYTDTHKRIKCYA